MNNILDIIFNNIENESKITHFYDKYKLSHSFSYKEIVEHSKLYAKNINQIVVSHREPILISLETGPDFIFSFFGTILAGHIPVPISSSTLLFPKDFKQLISQISESCEANHIITFDSFQSDELNIISPEVLNQEISIDDYTFNNNLDDICFIQFSSGSTQRPKGIAVSHRNILSNLEQIKKGMQVTNNDIICSWLPFHHDMGLIGVILASLYSMVESHLLSPLDFILSPKSWLELVSKKNVSIIVAPNSGYNVCIKKIKAEDVKNFDFSNLRLALSGAEPVNIDICRGFIKHFSDAKIKPNVIFPVYGLAEATLAVTFPKVNSPLKTLHVDYDDLTKKNIVTLIDKNEHSFEIISCGFALDQITLKIVSNNNEELSQGEIGEILVKGPAIVNHYYQKASHLSDGWLSTGDLGFLYDDELYIIGRKKDLIIINGKNIAANDIENKICKVSTLKLGKTVALSYIGKNKSEQVKIVAEICETSKRKRLYIKSLVCKELLPLVPLKPKDIYLIPPLLIKKTTSGKIKRYYIKHKYLTGRIKYWERLYLLFFIRSQLIIFWLKLSYTFKERLDLHHEKKLNNK